MVWILSRFSLILVDTILWRERYSFEWTGHMAQRREDDGSRKHRNRWRLRACRSASGHRPRSTVFPGVPKLVDGRLRTRARKIHVACCPERIAEGKAFEEIVTRPQIVAALEPQAPRRARELFLRITPSIIELTPVEAQLAKL